MHSLNKKQVELIISDVQNARITILHLADELIDHICCEVENQMSRGKNFDEAYDIIKQQTGIKVLQKIQENTQYLIDINYRRMKMTMKITGTASLAILGLATVMKISHWPWSNYLLMLGFVVLALVFFPSAIYANYKEVKVKASKLLHLSILIGGILFMAGVLFKVLHLPAANSLLLLGWVFIIFIFLPILLYVKLKESNTNREKNIIVTGIVGLIIFELSTMFKVLHYPGAVYLMIIGSILLVTIFLPLYTYSKFKETQKITGQYIFLLLSTMFFIIFSILLALNVSVNVLSVFENDKNNSEKISNYLELKNQVLYFDFKNKSDSIRIKKEAHVLAIQMESKKVREQIDSIELELIMATDQVDRQTAHQILNNTNSIKNKMDKDISIGIMIGGENKGLANQLKQNIIKFQETALLATTTFPELNNNIKNLINTSDIIINQENKTWEQFTFGNCTLISSISILKDIEKRIRMVESQAIQSINKKI